MGLSALGDQQLGGVGMAGEQAVVFFAVFAYWCPAFIAEQEQASAEEDAREASTLQGTRP